MAVTDWRVLRGVPVAVARMGMMLSKYWDSERRRDRLKLLLKIRSKRDMLLLPCEACQMMSAIDAVQKITGRHGGTGSRQRRLGDDDRVATPRAESCICSIRSRASLSQGGKDSERFRNINTDIPSRRSSDTSLQTIYVFIKDYFRKPPPGFPMQGSRSCTWTPTFTRAPRRAGVVLSEIK